MADKTGRRPSIASGIAWSCRNWVVCLLGFVGPCAVAQATWVNFVDETATRLVAAPGQGAGDVEEKTFTWGDLDGDSDTDLVIGRKEPFTTSGRRTNVLMLNQGGVLVDRTADFATASDVPGDQGFLTPTNDRDVQLVDVNGDGWLDVVTAVTISDGLPSSVGYPRVYVNLGKSNSGQWLGFRFESARIPLMLSYSGQPGHNPRFLSVAAGDVTGDGYADLWFTEGDSGGMYGAKVPPGADFNDRLLVNQGASKPGFFADATQPRILGVAPVILQEFERSNFGIAGVIADVNGDGQNDIVKQASGSNPRYVGVAYADDGGQGLFDTYGILANQQSAYYVSVGELNNDGNRDMVVTNDCADRFLLNTSAPGATTANFVSYNFSFAHAGTGGPASDDTFGGVSQIVDLDNDGWNDVLVTDVDADLKSCTRRMHVYRNLGGTPGGSVQLQEQTEGAGCQNFMSNPPSCTVAGIPAAELEGVHDVAVFDIDGDGFKDMVLGRCGGTRVYMQVPLAAAPVGVIGGGAGNPAALRAGKLADGRIHLDWAASCMLGDTDYEIYEGTLGSFASHVPRTCSTGGATQADLIALPGSRFYLVVPTNGVHEGGYGQASNGVARPASASACRPSSVGDCEE